jgi:hypothetical protein
MTMKSHRTNLAYQPILPFDDEELCNAPNIHPRHLFSTDNAGRRLVHEDMVPGDEWRGLAIMFCVVAFAMAMVATILGIYAFEHDRDK